VRRPVDPTRPLKLDLQARVEKAHEPGDLFDPPSNRHIRGGALAVSEQSTVWSTENPDSSGEDLSRRGIERRAVEAAIWGMPAVNFDLLYQAMAQAGGAWNQIVYWSRPLDLQNQTPTPNPDTIYVFPFIDTKYIGPVVLEIPPAGKGSITGSVDDAWQTALENVGPAGVDKGNGGKYLILPPG
jgi:hypothetical protein